MQVLKTLSFLFIFSIAVSYGQVHTENKLALIKTFEFIVKQQNTLEGIKENFPQLSIEANIAEIEFNKNFSKALSTIHFEVKNKKGIDFKEYLSNLKNDFNKNLNTRKLSRKEAISFISKVKNRAKGDMPSQHLKIFKAYENVANADTSLYTSYNVHEVKSYMNSRVLELKIKVPSNWKETDGMRPSVLKNFRSDYGKGNKMITIDRVDNQYTSREFTKKELLKFLPINSNLMSSQIKKVNTSKVGILEYEETNTDRKRIVVQYIIPQNTDILIMYCATYGAITDDLTTELTENGKKLYQTIFESIHFNNNNSETYLTYKD